MGNTKDQNTVGSPDSGLAKPPNFLYVLQPQWFIEDCPEKGGLDAPKK